VKVADAEVDPTTGNPNPMTFTKQFTITVTAGANNNKLFFNGYSFLFRGFDKDGFVAIAGFLTADGNGNITSGGEDVSRVSKVAAGARFQWERAILRRQARSFECRHAPDSWRGDFEADRGIELFGGQSERQLCL
jgi:hypothetical protein